MLMIHAPSLNDNEMIDDSGGSFLYIFGSADRFIMAFHFILFCIVMLSISLIVVGLKHHHDYNLCWSSVKFSQMKKKKRTNASHLPSRIYSSHPNGWNRFYLPFDWNLIRTHYSWHSLQGGGRRVSQQS